MLRLLLGLLLALGVLTEAAVARAQARCPSTQSSSLGAGAATTGRLALDGIQAKCGSTKAFPGANAASGVRYQLFPYVNRTNADACVSVTLTATAGEVETAAYLGAYPSSTPAMNYLADPGGSASALTGSTRPSQSYSFNVPALRAFLVMVQETVHGAGGTFSLAVSGCGDIYATGVSPAFGSVSGGGWVTVQGTGFLPGATVALGGAQLTEVSVDGDTSLGGFTSAHAPGVVDAVVTNTDGTTATVKGGFTYMPLAASSVQLAATPSAAVYGQSVTFTAQVAGSNPPASLDGVVTLSDGAQVLAQQNVWSGEAATFTIDALAVGSHPITASFDGGSFFTPSKSKPLTLVVGKGATTMTFLSSVEPSSPGLPTTFTAMLDVVAPAAGLPTGTVTFLEGTTTLGTGTLDASGRASLTLGTLALGSHSLSASYAGDASFGASSAALTETVVAGATHLGLTSSNLSPTYGEAVSFQAFVSGQVAGQVPTGTVSFVVDGAPLATVTVDGIGSALAPAGALSVGSHAVIASYGGDTLDMPATASLSLTVGPSATQTTIVSSQNPSKTTDDVTITVTVTGAGTPAGTVDFVDSLFDVYGSVDLVNGVATYDVRYPRIGEHSIVATYRGDGAHATSTSFAFVQAVYESTVPPTPPPPYDYDGGSWTPPSYDYDAGSYGGYVSPPYTEPPIERTSPTQACGCLVAGASASGSLFASLVTGLAFLALGRRRRR